MPIYEYMCEDHGSFEELKKISDRTYCKCPLCGVDCPQSLTVPAGIMGGYMDKNISMTNSKVRSK